MRLKNGNYFFAFVVVYIYLLIDYFMLRSAFEITFIIQMTFIFIAVSPIGEAINRLIYGGRKIITAQDKEYLTPIFTDVYKSYLEKTKRASRRIKLYIDRSMSVNSYAIGSNTIIITRGAIETLSPEQLKGVIAHEFGHLYNGDTLLLLILLGSNIYLYIVNILMAIIRLIFNTCDIITGEEKVAGMIGKVLLWVCSLIAVPTVLFIRLVLSVIQRDSEYNADKYAYKFGYGENLISVLYKLDKLDFSDGKMNLYERLMKKHPDIDKRIERLESFSKEKIT